MPRRRTRGAALGALAIRALRRAVEKAVQEHRRFGVPLVIWRNGKMARISASSVRLRKSTGH